MKFRNRLSSKGPSQFRTKKYLITQEEWPKDWNLQNTASISLIATFIITTFTTLNGVWGYFSSRYKVYLKRRQLVDYLKEQKRTANDKGQRSLLHLVRHVGLTADEILKMSCKRKRIERRIKKDAKGYAESLLFGFV